VRVASAAISSKRGLSCFVFCRSLLVALSQQNGLNQDRLAVLEDAVKAQSVRYSNQRPRKRADVAP
jgi:hypothetical protein